jgi:transposase
MIAQDKRFYLDETGSCLNMAPLYGRSQKGQRVYDKRPSSPGKRVNTLAILSEEGIKAPYHYVGSLSADVFIAYLKGFVLPILTDGQTIIMDNHPVHRAKSVLKYLIENTIKFLYLPPYSPDLNPIEEAFSKFKQFIKKKKDRTLDSLIIVMDDALKTITRSDSVGYFKHAYEF